MIKNIRFFCLAIDNEITGLDYYEITENEFIKQSQKLHSIITYERDTIFENGVDQVCLTVECDEWPSVDDIERIL